MELHAGVPDSGPALEAQEAQGKFELQWVGEVRVEDQRGCARCGADEHLQLRYLPLTNHIDMGDGFIATHWASCPTNWEPILFCQGDAP